MHKSGEKMNVMQAIGKEIWEWVKTIALSFALAFVISLFIQPTIVKGESMYPTLENKDLLVVFKMAYIKEKPHQGDVVIFESPFEEKNYIKRIIGIPGDRVEVKKGEVYVNNQKLQEKYISTSYTQGDIDLIVPEGKVFVLGDNRWPNASLDSRSSLIGLVSISSIKGKTVFRVFPLRRIGDI